MSAAHTHNCSAVGCQKQVPLNLLMCMTHWRMVPAPMARAVLATWRIRQRRPGDRTAMSQHEEAKAAAIAAVEAKQNRKIADRQATDGDLLSGLGL